jgi:hypothetical protein
MKDTIPQAFWQGKNEQIMLHRIEWAYDKPLEGPGGWRYQLHARVWPPERLNTSLTKARKQA